MEKISSQDLVKAGAPPDLVRKFREERKKTELAHLGMAMAFGARFLHLLGDVASSFLPSSRRGEDIALELKTYFSARPRPWRAHLGQQRRKARAGRQYRRLQGVKRYNGLINKESNAKNG